MPGIKTVRSNPAELPLVISVERLELEPRILKTFEDRLVLAFTGKTRLAKNILQNVLRRWARRTNEIVGAVERIVSYGEQARAALATGDFELFGKTLFETSKLKVLMAGEDSGAQPESVRKLVADLMTRKVIEGASLCGAGGGGFMVILASDGYDTKQIERIIKKELIEENEDLEFFTFHGCRVSDKGLTMHIIEDETIDLESFDLSWQCPERKE